MIDIRQKTLIILPHLDDEFALTPLIEAMTKINTEITIIYCSERIVSKLEKQKQRRIDNKKALKILGININKIIYLNDYFSVSDNRLFKSSLQIYNFLKNFLDQNFYSQVFTLNFEGGHPDHDQLALIINKLSLFSNFKAFYFPAYNYRSTAILPYSVLRPLKSQENYSKIIRFSRFCWFSVFKIAFIYSTERNAFTFLLPGLIYKAIFSKKLLYFDQIYISSVNWVNSLSNKRYKINFKDLFF